VSGERIGRAAVTLTVGELVVRLTVAAALGAVIGLEREPAGRGVGLRTHSIVALGAAVFTLAGAYGFADVETGGDVDPARVAAQVAAGVGFIGAGAILRHGSSVQGVTTAATVWLAAGVGVMASAGGLLAATVATVIAMVSLLALRSTKPYVRRLGRRHTVVEMTYARGHGTLGPVLRLLGEKGAMVDRIEVEDDDLDVDRPGIRCVRIAVSTGRREMVDELIGVLSERPELRSIAVDGRRTRPIPGPTGPQERS
jgi:putative Mg2+ transporter-C (MgtC) family protein